MTQGVQHQSSEAKSRVHSSIRHLSLKRKPLKSTLIVHNSLNPSIKIAPSKPFHHTTIPTSLYPNHTLLPTHQKAFQLSFRACNIPPEDILLLGRRRKQGESVWAPIIEKPDSSVSEEEPHTFVGPFWKRKNQWSSKESKPLRKGF